MLYSLGDNLTNRGIRGSWEGNYLVKWVWFYRV